MTAALKLLLAGTFNRGIVLDTARHAVPGGGVFDAKDFLLERPGLAYKRGGWERHSALIGATGSIAAVATIHIPTRVVAVDDDGTLYDVTSEGGPEALDIDSCFTPGENPPLYAGKLIFCDPAASDVPNVVYYDSGADSIAVWDLFDGAAIPASHSMVHGSYVVLGRGDNSDAEHSYNRIWFPPDPDLEPLVDINDTFIETSHEVVGFASCSGVLLVFSPTAIERVLGSVPPGRGDSANMELQPLASVGCLDARSIVHLDESVIFAGQEGVWLTNGSAVRSLTSRPDGTGIQSFWRGQFPAGEARQIIGGLLERDFYIVSILDDTNGPIITMLLHIPSQCWIRLGNVSARMYAQGRTEQESLELYFAAAGEGYVDKLSSILIPQGANQADGDGTAVTPLLELSFGDAGVLKEFRQGRLTHRMTTEVTAVWAAAHVYAISDTILANSQVWQITARTGDFKSGATQPVWASTTTVGDTLTDNHVTWTNRGPLLSVATSPGLYPDDFTTQAGMTLNHGARRTFDILLDNEQTFTVLIRQTGASATTEIYGVEADVRTHEQGVTGGE